MGDAATTDGKELRGPSPPPPLKPKLGQRGKKYPASGDEFQSQLWMWGGGVGRSSKRASNLQVLLNYGHHRYSKACPSGGKGLTTRVEDMMHSRTKGGARKQTYMKAATMTRKAKNDEERKAQKSGKE